MAQVDLDYERGVAYERFHSQYRRHTHSGSCFYCGSEDTTDDHVPPLATVHKLRGYAPKHSLLLVRSCVSCNSALGDMPLMTPEERRDYIREVYLPQRFARVQQEITELEAQLASLRAELAHLRNVTPAKGDGCGGVPAGAVAFQELDHRAWFRRGPGAPKLYQKVDHQFCDAGGIRVRMAPTEWVYPAE